MNFKKLFGGAAKAEKLGQEAIGLLDNWQPNEALAKAREALEIDPDNADALTVCGFVCSSQKNHGEALQAYKRLQRLEPDVTEHWRFAGEEQIELGQLEEAAASFRQGLVRAPRSLPLQCKLASVLRKLHQQADAEKTLVTAISLAATEKEGLYELILTLAIFGKDDQMASILERLEQVDPEKAQEARRNLAILPLLPK